MARMGRARISILLLLASWPGAGCAIGPHPALALAKKDLGCDTKLTLHEIYTRKVRVEGCGKEAIYVKGCDSYGADAKCGWARQH